MIIVAFHFNETHLTKAQEYTLKIEDVSKDDQGVGSALITSTNG